MFCDAASPREHQRPDLTTGKTEGDVRNDHAAGVTPLTIVSVPHFREEARRHASPKISNADTEVVGSDQRPALEEGAIHRTENA